MTFPENSIESASKTRLRLCRLLCVPPRRAPREAAPREAILTTVVDWFLLVSVNLADAGASGSGFLRSTLGTALRRPRISRVPPWAQDAEPLARGSGFLRFVLKRAKSSALLVPTVTAMICYPAAPAAAVTFEDQAARLQNVNASLFDLYPKPTVPVPGYDLGAQLDFTFLPEIDGKVGSKEEKIPKAPLHLIPKAVLGAGMRTDSDILLAGRIWAGVLPPGGESLLGLDASLFHYLTGGEVVAGFPAGASSDALLSIIAQYSAAEVEGRIASKEGKDKFETNSVLVGIGVGARHRIDENLQVIADLRVYKKSTESTFTIEEDKTSVRLKDDLSNDASFGFPLTGSLGVRFRADWSLVYTQVVVPDRVVLPSITLTWHFFAPDAAKETPLKEARAKDDRAKRSEQTQNAPEVNPRKAGKSEAGKPAQKSKPDASRKPKGVKKP